MDVDTTLYQKDHKTEHAYVELVNSRGFHLKDTNHCYPTWQRDSTSAIETALARDINPEVAKDFQSAANKAGSEGYYHVSYNIVFPEYVQLSNQIDPRNMMDSPQCKRLPMELIVDELRAKAYWLFTAYRFDRKHPSKEAINAYNLTHSQERTELYCSKGAQLLNTRGLIKVPNSNDMVHPIHQENLHGTSPMVANRMPQPVHPDNLHGTSPMVANRIVQPVHPDSFPDTSHKVGNSMPKPIPLDTLPGTSPMVASRRRREATNHQGAGGSVRPMVVQAEHRSPAREPGFAPVFTREATRAEVQHADHQADGVHYFGEYGDDLDSMDEY